MLIFQRINFIIQVKTSMQTQLPKKFSYLDEFKIIKTLGAGYHAQVKLGMDNNGNLYAIKRYKKETANLSTLQHQLNIMKALQHENLVRLIDVRENALYKRKDQTTYKCFAIVLEYVGGGQLFDFVAETGKFSQKVSRTYFHQMMNGLYYMHSRGYAHRDIKPQNILISHDFTLKIADFGFACLLKGKDGSGILHTKLGTQGYMAPQIPLKNYKGAKTDIFAAGVILFIMFAGNPPFEKALPNDPYYRLLKQKNYSTFWKAHSRTRSQFYFSEAFKDLFVRMVAFDPEERPSIEQIAAHPWVKGPVCTQSELRQQFQFRKKKLDLVLQKRRQEQQAQKMAVSNSTNVTTSRGDLECQSPIMKIYESECDKSRQLNPLQPLNQDDFIVDDNITYVVATLRNFFLNKQINLEDSEQALSIDQSTLKATKVEDNSDTFNVTYEHSFQVERQMFKSEIQITVKLGETKDEKIAICLSHQKGNRLYYKKIAKLIKAQFAYCLN